MVAFPLPRYFVEVDQVGDHLCLVLAGCLGQIKLKGPLTEPLNGQVIVSSPHADCRCVLVLCHGVCPHL